jgi:Fic family protein
MPSLGSTASRHSPERAVAVEGMGRLKAKRSSSRTASRGIILEIELLLQRLLHLTSEEVSEADPLLEAAREIYDARRTRERIFGPGLFADPSWDILLDLFISKREGRKVTISSACIAASAPTTTATRHISHLVQVGLVVRVPHPSDARSAYLELSAAGDTKLSRLFREMMRAADIGA